MKINIQQVLMNHLPYQYSQKDLKYFRVYKSTSKHLTLTIKLSNSNDGSDLDHPPHFSDWLTQPKKCEIMHSKSQKASDIVTNRIQVS